MIHPEMANAWSISPMERVCRAFRLCLPHGSEQDGPSCACLGHRLGCLVVGVGDVDAVSFVKAWMRTFGLPAEGCPEEGACEVVLPMRLLRPHSMRSSWLRCVVASASELETASMSREATRLLEAHEQATVLILVDASRAVAPCASDMRMLCWAWRHAFPQLPVELVRTISRHLPTGMLRDECGCLSKTVRAVYTRHGPNFLASVVICNLDGLMARLMHRHPAHTIPTVVERLKTLHHMLSHILHASLHEACVAVSDHAASQAVRSGLGGYLAATTLPTYVLCAPELDLGLLSAASRASVVRALEKGMLASGVASDDRSVPSTQQLEQHPGEGADDESPTSHTSVRSLVAWMRGHRQSVWRAQRAFFEDLGFLLEARIEHVIDRAPPARPSRERWANSQLLHL